MGKFTGGDGNCVGDSLNHCLRAKAAIPGTHSIHRKGSDYGGGGVVVVGVVVVVVGVEVDERFRNGFMGGTSGCHQKMFHGNYFLTDGNLNTQRPQGP